MNIAIIPARLGSKRIHKKNIKKFCGKPIIAYAIDVAKSSAYIEQVFVSTDSEEIAEVATKFGAHITLYRPKNLSDDFTPIVPVISHAVKNIIDLKYTINNVCCIFPCTPLLTSQQIDNVYDRMVSGNHLFAYPVMLYSHPIQRAMKMNKNGKMEFFAPKNEMTRTQDLVPSFHDAGQFYWGTKNAWIKERKVHTDGIGVRINAWEAIDVDNEEDWVKAELVKNSSHKI